MNKQKVSVILPTFNERENIVSLIEDIHLELGDYNHQILVVDDNSPDGTYQTVLELNLPYVKAILRQKDPGLANSIRCGLENAEGEVFVVMDSDYNHQPKYLPFMVQALSYYDCVSASRFLYGGGMDSWIRHKLSWLFNIFVRIVTRGFITDSLYGFFAIKKGVIEKCNYNDIFWGYGDYCIRLMWYLQRNRASILQFPAVNGKRTKGKGNSKFIRVFWQYFTEVLKLAYKERIKRHVQRN
ncbi:MAG: glycosyltransferase [bacterium]